MKNNYYNNYYKNCKDTDCKGCKYAGRWYGDVPKRAYKAKNILLVVYNCVGRPFAVFTDDKCMWDFYYKDKRIQCFLTGFNYHPYLNKLNLKFENRLKVYSSGMISNEEIKKMKYIKINRIEYCEEILYVLNQGKNNGNISR
jgi:hypothetical protein